MTTHPELACAAWHKSSYSSGSGGACVEVASAWRTSSYTSGSGGQCVEVGPAGPIVGVRDSKDRDGGALAVPAASWSHFVEAVKSRAL